MHLKHILQEGPIAAAGVPDWMLGYFKRRSISFANGTTDTQTHVCWLQSRNFSIDLRLPIATQQVAAKPWQDYSAEELRTLGNYEGWVADSIWNGKTLAWQNEMALQLHGRWQEPAFLTRIGNCMMEFAPSAAYVEDWRLQASAPGPLVGLRLLSERQLQTDTVTRTGGGLIICGDYAALVLARPQNHLFNNEKSNALRELAQKHIADEKALSALFDFETSVAHGSMASGFTVTLSTRPERIGQAIFSLDGFEWRDKTTLVQQCVSAQGEHLERIFAVDTLEPMQTYAQTTETTDIAGRWFAQEAETLCRYTQSIYQ